MKYCVIADLQFSLPTLRSQMTQTLKDKLVDKLTGEMLKRIWGSIELTEGVSEGGKPLTSFIVRFDKQEDMEELFALIKDRIVKLPVLKGRVSKHHCPHDGDSGSCQDTWEEYVKE